MNARRLRLIAAAAAVAALALTGCSASSTTILGDWGDSTKRDQPSLSFAEDGKVSGTDGCNRIMGSYTEKGGEIKFSQLASTMMFCEGVDTWLGQAATGTVSGDTLTINDEAGSKIGTLARSK